jgi:hypothetical protein
MTYAYENTYRDDSCMQKKNQSCQIIESVLKYKNGFKNNLMYRLFDDSENRENNS